MHTEFYSFNIPIDTLGLNTVKSDSENDKLHY